MTIRQNEIVKELISIANKVGVNVPPGEIESFMRDPNHYIFEEYVQNSSEPYYWRHETNFNKMGVNKKEVYKLQQEYLKLKIETK